VAPIEPIAVLVVDESEAFLGSTLQWIESRPDLCLAGLARNGFDALDAVERLSPDLVIIEAFLNGAEGLQLAREIKKEANAPLVLIVTFHASAAVRDTAYASGADGFLAKYDFSDGVETLLEMWRAERAGRERQIKTPAKPVRRESRTVPDP
jgi:DNA-binding NarL/FixJ family response regulator